MYLFPTIDLPEKAIKAAEEKGKKPDDFYCLALLDATGICVVPGSGFGQKPSKSIYYTDIPKHKGRNAYNVDIDTLHFRTTFLAPGTEWVGRMTQFHKEFLDKYRS